MNADAFEKWAENEIRWQQSHVKNYRETKDYRNARTHELVLRCMEQWLGKHRAFKAITASSDEVTQGTE